MEHTQEGAEGSPLLESDPVQILEELNHGISMLDLFSVPCKAKNLFLQRIDDEAGNDIPQGL